MKGRARIRRRWLIKQPRPNKYNRGHNSIKVNQIQVDFFLRKSVFILYVITLCALPIASLGGTSALTENSVDDRLPKIHNGQVVWQISDEYRWQICLYNGETIIQLTDNDMLNIGPKIDNRQVAWMSHYMFDPLEINFFDGQQSYQITENDICDTFPSISNGKWRMRYFSLPHPAPGTLMATVM